MSLFTISALPAMSAGAILAVALAAPASAAAVTATATFNCPANANTPCKVSLTADTDYYSDAISCDWTNPKVTLVQAAVINNGSSIFTASFALTPEERSARGMVRSEPVLPVASTQQLQITFKATNSAANTVTCYVLGY